MKRFLLGGLLVAGMCTGLYADSAEDAQFKQYVELSRNSPTNPEGMTLCADNTYRIIYAAMPIALNKSDATPELIKVMKTRMLAEMVKQKADCKIIKDLKINMVYTFITSDKNIFTITISYKDLK